MSFYVFKVLHNVFPDIFTKPQTFLFDPINGWLTTKLEFIINHRTSSPKFSIFHHSLTLETLNILLFPSLQ